MRRGEAVAAKSVGAAKLNGGAGRREGRGGDRLGEIRATTRLLDVQLLLAKWPGKHLRVCMREGGVTVQRRR